MMEARLDAVEKRQNVLEARLDTLTKEMGEQTRTIGDIKSDTGQIVAWFKASQLGATVIKWCATVGGAFIVGYAAWKGLKG